MSDYTEWEGELLDMVAEVPDLYYLNCAMCHCFLGASKRTRLARWAPDGSTLTSAMGDGSMTVCLDCHRSITTGVKQ